MVPLLRICGDLQADVSRLDVRSTFEGFGMATSGSDSERSRERLSEIVDEFTQALRLAYGEVELAENPDAAGELGFAADSQHIDVAHWDVGTGHCDGLHPDLHGDLPHWDSDVRVLSQDQRATDSSAEGRWAVVLAEHRYLLEWTRQIAARLEQRMTALEQAVQRSRTEGGGSP